VSLARTSKSASLPVLRFVLESTTRLTDAAVIASDETTTRIDGITHWHWTFVTDRAVLHEIAPRRAKAVAEDILGDHRPEVWVSDRYAGQQELATHHQVCLAHVLRDVQYAIDRGDEAFAPELRALLRWAIRVGRRRDELRDTTLAQYHGKAERRLDDLLAIPPTCSAGRELQAQVKAWRGKYFLFLTDDRVPRRGVIELCPARSPASAGRYLVSRSCRPNSRRHHRRSGRCSQGSCNVIFGRPIRRFARGGERRPGG